MSTRNGTIATGNDAAVSAIDERGELERIEADDDSIVASEQDDAIGEAEARVVARLQIFAPVPAEALRDLIREGERDLGGRAEAGDEERSREDAQGRRVPMVT